MVQLTIEQRVFVVAQFTRIPNVTAVQNAFRIRFPDRNPPVRNTILKNIIHLMSAPEGNSEFCFPESLNVSRDEVEGNIESRGETKPAISRGCRH